MRLYSLSPRLRTRLWCLTWLAIHFVQDFVREFMLSEICWRDRIWAVIVWISFRKLRLDVTPSEFFDGAEFEAQLFFWDTSPEIFLTEFKPHLYFYFFVACGGGGEGTSLTWLRSRSVDVAEFETPWFFSLFLYCKYQCHTSIGNLQPLRHLYRFWKSISKPRRKGGAAFLIPTHMFFDVASLFFYSYEEANPYSHNFIFIKKSKNNIDHFRLNIKQLYKQ